MMTMSKSVYVKKTGRLNRSFDCIDNAGTGGDPWKLLASAIIFQAAVDCQNWTPAIEESTFDAGSVYGIRFMRFAKLREFINSDWIDALLSWQTEIRPEAVCEELVRRLTSETIST